jgi:hypothetical protein
MATMNKTFSVKTGLDLANTIILDSNRNISNVNVANVHTVNANSIVTVGGLNVVDQANTARTTANDAYAQANTARDTANDAYGQANTARATANDAYGQANAAYGQANSARDQANTGYGQANAAYGQANAAYGQANAAYAEANISANTVSVTVGGLTLNNKKLILQNTNSMTIELLDDGVNANLVLKSSGGIAYDQANAAYGQANAARDQANTARATGNDAYAQANTARDTANDAYGQANTARTVANNAYGQANLAYAQANTARDTANDAYGQANTARNTANDAYGQANTAYGQANAAYLQANNAYAEANLKLNLTGGVIIGDLTVDGNLFVNGVQTVVNTESLTINDPIFLLGNNNTTNSVALGFTAHYGPTQQHTGLIRAHQDNLWYLFEDYDEHILYANNVLDTGNIKLATLRANINANSLLLLGNTVATQANLTIAHDQANAAYGQANTARATGNDAYAQANTARDTANGAYSQANGAYAQANGAYAQANGAYDQANGAYSQANGAYSQANGAYSQANVSANTVRVYANSAGELSNKFLNFVNTASIQVSVIDNGDGNANITFSTTGAAVADAYAQANAGYNQANAAYGQANAAYGQANAAYGQANAAYGQANLAYAQANAAYDEANTKVETIVTGLGLSNSVATVANVVTVTITPNIATTTVIGVTKLVDSITSTDTANAATPNSVNWLETKKVDRAGDTMTGKLTITVAGEGLEVANANVTNTLTVEALKVTTNTVTTAASGQVVLDVFPTTELASAKYFVQANSGSTYHTTEIVLVQEGTNIWMTEYGSIQTGAPLGTFNADIDSGNVRLLFNATQSINTIRAVRYGIVP